MTAATVRLLGAADGAEYRALRLRALREHPDAFTSSHEEEDRKPAGWYADRLVAADMRFVGAFVDGRLCGVVGLDREARAKNRHKATVVGMYVAPECQGLGLGRQLMDALLAQARADGLEMLVLTVTDGNDGARRLYEGVGFRSFGIEPRALRLGAQYFAKNHMALQLA